MNTKFTIRLMLLIFVGGMITTPQLKAQDVLVTIDDIIPEEVHLAGFSLSSDQEIEIEALGTHQRSRRWSTSSAWILDADTREIVWELTDANSSWVDRGLREYKDRVSLNRGRYEVYFSYFPENYNIDGWSITRFFFRRHDDDDDDRRRRYRDDYEEFQITVKGDGRGYDESETIAYREGIQEKAMVSLLASRDDRYENQGFKLKKDMDVVVYALGEARDDGTYDYGWIMNADTREKVWQFKYRYSDHAGGSEKNRMIRETVSLPAGNYSAFYVTDDSHSPREWNTAPPYDPEFWGLSIYAQNDNDRGAISLYDYEDMPEKNVIVNFTGLRDDEYVSKGFTLKKDMDVRIYALGEGSRGEMYDYGWIVDAKTHKRVWEMNYRNTDHAGGNSKNRLADEVIELEKGNYVAHFVTDDSHSYRRWNTSPPFDQEKWGITILGVGDNFRASDVTEYNEDSDNSDVMARITRVRDWETRKERFEMKKDGNVRVYALGEGSDGRMYDYAWIENASTGKVVWEMTYRRTDHAGGARKNREFNDTIYLKSGEYLLIYESDDSHSFKDWNSAPPRDPANWGVTIYKAN